jgi:hypothetical protein
VAWLWQVELSPLFLLSWQAEGYPHELLVSPPKLLIDLLDVLPQWIAFVWKSSGVGPLAFSQDWNEQLKKLHCFAVEQFLSIRG